MRDGEGDEPTTYEEVRRDAVDSEIANYVEREEAAFDRFSQYRRALDDLTTAAVMHAVQANLPPRGGYGEADAEDLIYAAIAVLSQLRMALGHGYEDGDLSFWTHHEQALYDLKAKKAPQLDRSEIEGVIGRYLKLPFRAPATDRMLVDLLIALEFYAYGNEVINAPSIPGLGSSSPLKRGAILEWIVGNFIPAALWALLALGMWGLNVINVLPEGWLIGGNVVLGGLFLLNLVWSTVWLPRNWWVLHRAKATVVRLLEAMNGVYAELRSDGPISARHIEHRARSAADAGVGWPAPLFALLDDINGRGGRF